MADRSQRAIPAEVCFVAQRRLTMPELLEDRNAPSAIVPLPSVFGAVFAADGGEDLLFAQQQDEELAHYHTAAYEPSIKPSLSIDGFVHALRAADAESQQRQTQIDAARQATEFRTPAQIAALNTAFNSFATGGFEAIFFDARLIPPPVTHPVEPPEEEYQADQGLVTMPETIGETSPSDSVGADSPSASERPITRSDDASVAPVAELPPPLIQPAITDPESEHNQPSPEPAPEAAPPLIQPVIMDPESEHNQELDLANFVE